MIISLARPRIQILASAILALATSVLFSSALFAQTMLQTDIPGPAGSGAFGTTVTVLANGNFVVSDPYYDANSVQDVGSVILYDGVTLQPISQLLGSSAFDQVGSNGVVALPNGNFVVVSSIWGGNIGAVTLVNGSTGLNGAVSAANSLVGSGGSDYVGSGGVVALTNSNYVVISPGWDNGASTDGGAVTWGNGITGIDGEVNSTNSLVGGGTGDNVGNGGITVLTNGNYVVRSYFWRDPALSPSMFHGAVTWGSGVTGVQGLVTPLNSLTGGATHSYVGIGGVLALANGNYVVASPNWYANLGTGSLGATTWGNGTTGTTGTVNPANSLVGSTSYDSDASSVAALANGNYVVAYPKWDSPLMDAGAVTWGDGTKGITGAISAANSLIGEKADDALGLPGITPLTNGHYVVRSQYWDNGAAAGSGAVTWANGYTTTTGFVTTANSIVGTQPADQVGLYATALSNGNYVIYSPEWDEPESTIVDAGAVTWADGTMPTSAVVSSANSLVGSSESDQVGSGGVYPLSNGNYVVASPIWDGDVVDFGAATWGDGTQPLIGAITSGNSLIGSSNNDRVGSAITPLSNGNYVVASPEWNAPGVTDAGAVTWGNGSVGTNGMVSTANSLVGATPTDKVGHNAVRLLPNGNYYVRSGLFDGTDTDSGAVTPIFRLGGVTSSFSQTITSMNSVLGTAAGAGAQMNLAFNPTRPWMAVGRPGDNIVTIVSFVWPLQVSLLGAGSGEVTSQPAAIECGAVCSADIEAGAVITLTATEGAESLFTGWGGACTGASYTCILTMTQALSVTATFAPLHQFSLEVSGNGNVLVSTAAGSADDVTCAANQQCDQVVISGTIVSLTASPEQGHHFVEWSGQTCEADADALIETCSLTMHASKGVTAVFAPDEFVFNILFEGNGNGDIDFIVGGDGGDAIDECDNGGGVCQRTFYHGDQLIILATPEADSVFEGYTGFCGSVIETECRISVSAPLTLTAHFLLKVYEVSVGKGGSGVGSITVTSPADVCQSKAPCVFTTTHGSQVSAQAAAFPSAGSRFAGWSGDCSGDEPICTLTITGSTKITGSFGLSTWMLNVTTSGEGVVTSTPAAINCGSGGALTCSASFTHGTNVQLVATPASGYVFSGWTTFCAGKGLCHVPMTQGRSVQAIFEDENSVDPDPEYRGFLPAIQN